MSSFPYKHVILIFLVAGACCCTNVTPVINNQIDSTKIGKIKSVLVLGNSILYSDPQPGIKWFGDWGMAASSMDSDFIHLLMSRIYERDSSVSIKTVTVGDFEEWFENFNYKNFDKLRNPDLLIMRISENVSATRAIKDNFIKHYDSLINYIDPGHHAVKLLTDGIWDKSKEEGARGDVNAMIKDYALKNKYPFVSIYDIGQNPSLLAGGQYQDKLVGKHPNDKGMRIIADRIWNYIGIYFKFQRK